MTDPDGFDDSDSSTRAREKPFQSPSEESCCSSNVRCVQCVESGHYAESPVIEVPRESKNIQHCTSWAPDPTAEYESYYKQEHEIGEPSQIQDPHYSEDPESPPNTSRQIQWNGEPESLSEEEKESACDRFSKSPEDQIVVISPSAIEKEEWDRVSSYRYVSTCIGKPICAICKKGFANRTTLQVHMRIHSGEKPFKCPTCGKSFAQSGNLRAHIRVHTGERPYACTRCNNSFSQSSSLHKHYKRKHLQNRSKKVHPTVCSVRQLSLPR